MSSKRFTKFAVPLALLLFAGTAHAAPLELSVNGGFETGDFTGWTQFSSFSGGIPDPGNSQQTIDSVNNNSGSFHGLITNLEPATPSLIKQANVGVGTVVAGETITISFSARGGGVGGVAFAEVFGEIAGGGTSSSVILGGGPLAINPDPDVWTDFMFTTPAGPDVSGGITLQLNAVNGAFIGATSIMHFDDISISVNRAVIPVPAAVWLFGSGLLGLIGVARRKKAA